MQRESGVLVLKCKKLCLQEMEKMYRCWILVDSVVQNYKIGVNYAVFACSVGEDNPR